MILSREGHRSIETLLLLLPLSFSCSLDKLGKLFVRHLRVFFLKLRYYTLGRIYIIIIIVIIKKNDSLVSSTLHNSTHILTVT